MEPTADLCDRCRQTLSGSLVKFSTDKESTTEKWLIGSRHSDAFVLLSPEKINTFWNETVSDITAAFEYVAPATSILFQSPESSVLPVRHHTCEDLVSSASAGCRCCQQLVNSLNSIVLRVDRMQEVGNAQGIPVLQYIYQHPHEWKEPLAAPRLLEDRSLVLSIHYPGAANHLLSCNIPAIQLFGPRPPPLWPPEGHELSAHKTVAQIKGLLESCRQHEVCSAWRKTHSSLFRDKPGRLLQISKDSNHAQIRLREYKEITNESVNVAYVTLSHCWGGFEIPGKLVSSNYARYAAGISVKKLPKTFRDATRFTTALGYEFIWIDALCIVQDSEEDWAHESSRMGSVYSNAVLNIAASASRNCERGLFRQPGHGGSNVELSYDNPAVRPGQYSMYPVMPNGTGYGRSPLNRRAWVFQERMFSPVIIEFLNPQIQWQCRQWWGTDNFDIGDPMLRCDGRIMQAGRSLEDMHLILESQGITSVWQSERRPVSAWYKLCKEYMGRHILKASDRLVAFSAVAKSFAHANGMDASDYLAGLWRPLLREQLLWSIKLEGMGEPWLTLNEDPESAPTVYVAPSWSWASWPWASLSRDTCLSEMRDERAKWPPDFKILSASTQPIDEEGFGGISSAFIEMQCLLYRVRIWDDREITGGFSSGIEVEGHGEFGGWYTSDYRLPLQDAAPDHQTCYSFIPMAKWDHEYYPSRIEGIVVRPVERPVETRKSDEDEHEESSDVQSFERVGLLRLSPNLDFDVHGKFKVSQRWQRVSELWEEEREEEGDRDTVDASNSMVDSGSPDTGTSPKGAKETKERAIRITRTIRLV